MEIFQVRSARNDVLLLHGKAKPKIKIAVNEPIHGEPAHCETSSSNQVLLTLCTAPGLLFLRNPEGDAQGGIMNNSAQRGTAVPDCPSTLFHPSLAPATVDLSNSLHFWTSKEEKLGKRSWKRV